MQRRTFLSAGAIAATATALRPTEGLAAPAPAAELVDTNVTLGQWATRRAGPENAAALVAKLRAHRVTSAWAGTFEGVLHSDIAGANVRLAEACAREGSGILRPFGAINPTLPDWEDDVRRCHEVHRMPGVRLFPNYHGYTLEDPRFARLIELATQRRLLVQIALTLEDDRSQNPVLVAEPVTPAPLVDVMQKFSGARVMLLNGGPRVFSSVPLLSRLAAAQVLLELSTLEGLAGIEALLKKAPSVRLTFGSQLPFFYFEAALLKLQESALTGEQLAAIMHGNARAALQ